MEHGMPSGSEMLGYHPSTDLNSMPMTSDGQGDMMNLFDSSVMDSMAMNMDGFGSMMQPEQFNAMSQAQNGQSSYVSAGGSVFSPTQDDDNMGAPASMNTGFSAAPSQSSGQPGSMLTEFTKRRNWPAKVIEEIKDFLQILDARGKIKYVSPSITTLTGHKPEDMVDQFLKDMIHPDDIGTFTSEMNESIASGNKLVIFFRLKKSDGGYAIFEAVGHAHIAAAKFAPNVENQSPFCQAVFMMCRPYPTKNAQLLDSFLEHKIENERLQRRIAELRREEEQEEASHSSWIAGQEARSDVTPSESMMTSSQGPPGLYTQMSTASDSASMPPPERPSSHSNLSHQSLTRENLDSAAGARPDSIRDKMARYEGASHTDTIEMLTGLNYVDGERSKGITTGNQSPTLIKGDAGIAIPMDRDPRTGEKKKKLKVAEEYVCTDCGTLDSPEWRKGPSGPKTLCNACGLRWAKKEKKRHAGGGGGVTSQAAAMRIIEP